MGTETDNYKTHNGDSLGIDHPNHGTTNDNNNNNEGLPNQPYLNAYQPPSLYSHQQYLSNFSPTPTYVDSNNNDNSCKSQQLEPATDDDTCKPIEFRMTVNTATPPQTQNIETTQPRYERYSVDEGPRRIYRHGEDHNATGGLHS
eukprot:gene673-832_t